MDAVDAVGMVVAVLVPAAAVLREVAAGDRPAQPGQAEGAGLAFADPAPELVVTPVLGVGLPPAAAPVEVAAAVPYPVVAPAPVVAAPPVAAPPVAAPRVAAPPTAAPAHPAPEPEPERVRRPDPEAEVETAPAEPAHGSILAGLSGTEPDDHSALRRAGALVLLLGVTFAAAAMVAAGIYRAVAGLG